MDLFDLEVKVIEKEIIEHLLNYKIFSVRGEITSKILFLFITRKDLTQSDLHHLTGYSAGKISQELNNMLELGLISISRKIKPWIYTMESVVVETFSRAIALLKRNLKWEPKFLEIKKDLEETKEELQKLNGYQEIQDFLDVNLLRFQGFKGFVRLWEDLKKKYQNQSL